MSSSPIAAAVSPVVVAKTGEEPATVVNPLFGHGYSPFERTRDGGYNTRWSDLEPISRQLTSPVEGAL